MRVIIWRNFVTLHPRQQYFPQINCFGFSRSGEKLEKNPHCLFCFILIWISLVSLQFRIKVVRATWMLFLCVFVFVLHGSDVNEVNADVKLSVYPSIIYLDKRYKNTIF